MWIDFSNWAKDVKTLMSHVDAHLKVMPAEEEFSNQIDKVTFLWTVSLFHPFLSIAQWAHEQSSHGGRDGDLAWAQ